MNIENKEVAALPLDAAKKLAKFGEWFSTVGFCLIASGAVLGSFWVELAGALMFMGAYFYCLGFQVYHDHAVEALRNEIKRLSH